MSAARSTTPHNALLYCAMALPDPRSPAIRDAVHDELAALITAAGGRTLALFTSWAAMDAAAAAVADRVDVPILTQRDLPKPALLRAFAADEATCLFATAGFFQGVDVPGRTLSQVVIDRLPFPRPDDPLLSARRELLGAGRVPRDRRAAGGDDARPGRRTADPHRRPIAAWSPCSTAAWARPATAGTSSTPCPRCGAPAIALRSKRSSPTITAD